MPHAGRPYHTKQPCTTDFELCALCQEETGAAFQCPAKSSKAPIGNGYKSLPGHLVQFQEVGHMPMDMDTDRLDDGYGMDTTMMTQLAGWHKHSM